MNRSFFVSTALGFLFAIGLGISGMTDANKVIGFLNLAGSWDPSLALVMGGALAVTIPAYQLYKNRKTPLLGGTCSVPQGGKPDRKLLVGAALFGIGWGLGGFCPGPGLVSAVSGSVEALVFTGAMMLGMLGYARATSPQEKTAPPEVDPMVDDECVQL